MRRRSNESRIRGAETDETGGLHVPVVQIVERLIIIIEEPAFSFILASRFVQAGWQEEQLEQWATAGISIQRNGKTVVLLHSCCLFHVHRLCLSVIRLSRAVMMNY